MTAEIAVMNKTAVALAADSAVTSGGKIYNTANKLFALSKFHPIGIMIYGSAELMGVPWETLIKVYRAKLKTHQFSNMQEYMDDFINFIENRSDIFTEQVQSHYFELIVNNYFIIIKDDIKKKVEKIDGPITLACANKIVKNTISSHYSFWQSIDILPKMTQTFESEIIKRYDKIIEKVRNRVFQKEKIDLDSLKKLKKICGFLFTRKNFRNNITGIVIAGFGKNEVFPSVIDYQVEVIINNKLKCGLTQKMKVNLETSAGIVPFAQCRDETAVFMEGIQPDYRKCIDQYLTNFLNCYPEYILNGLPRGAISDKKAFISKLNAIGEKLKTEFDQKTVAFARKKYTQPIMTAVSVLPKDELASLAESIVELTSLKRKVTMTESETVGGPIDVAVISKGDGFIWIKRKHYFDIKYNPYYKANNFFNFDNKMEIKNEKKRKNIQKL